VNPAQRRLRARLAAYSLHGHVDGREHTAPARAAFLDQFLHEADPDGILPEEERRRRAGNLLKAYMCRLALASSRARTRDGH
jgi:hypothetical protein